MTLNLKLDKQGTKQVNTLLQELTFSWRTTLLGLASVVYGVIQAFSGADPTLDAALHDQKLWMALIVAIMGFVAKDSTAHGTATAPITPQAAAQLAAVAANAAPASAFVGGLVPGSTSLYTALPNDPTPVGQTVTVAGLSYLKIAPGFYEKR